MDGKLAVRDLSDQSPEDLVQQILGEGLDVVGVTFRGAPTAAGTFTGGSGVIGFDSGIILSSGAVHNVIGPNESDGISAANGLPGDVDLNALIPGFQTYDATVLEFDFIPDNEIIVFQFVFASDEYNEFVYSRYNDVFGFFVNGRNIALVPGTDLPVSINNLNGGNPFGHNPANPQYYRNNDPSDGGGGIDTEMDGLTVVLSVQAHVRKGEVNHVKLAIADAGDRLYDSTVFIRVVKTVEPPKVEVSKINDSADPYYDDVYRPGGQEWIHVSIYVAPSDRLETVEIWVDDQLVQTRPAALEFSWPWLAPDDVGRHEIRVVARDTEGGAYTGTLTLYALVVAEGSVVTYLPEASVKLPLLDMDISPFHEDPLFGETPYEDVDEYLAQGVFRQINTLTLEGKSDGTRFVATPRVRREGRVNRSWYCDDPLTGQDRLAYEFPPPPVESNLDSPGGAYYYAQSHYESMVNARAPDVWASWVPRVSPPLPPIGYTGGSPMVPTIFSTVRVEIWADGRTRAAWVDDKGGPKTVQSSWFPYHYAYLDGELVPMGHPPVDLTRWIGTTPAWPDFLPASAALPAALYWFAALRAECARVRLAELNPRDYQILHQTFPQQLLPRHFRLILEPLKEELWPHMWPSEWEEGKPWPYQRKPECRAPGCPGWWRDLVTISLWSPVEVHVYDTAGNHTGPRADGWIEFGLPDVFYWQAGHRTFIMLPNRPEYRVEFKGYAQGLVTINITEFSGPEKVRYLQYYNVPVTTSSRGIVALGGVESPVQYDLHGTGHFETLQPTLVTSDPTDDDTDKRPPTTSALFSGTEGEPGYFRSPVEVTLTATDDLAGVERTEYSLDGGLHWQDYAGTLRLEGEGAYALRYRSVDYVGNREEAVERPIVVDMTPPSLSLDGGGAYTVDQVVTITCTASDELSGLADDPCEVPLVSAPAFTFALGVHRVAATASDRAGNARTAEATFTVAVTYDALCSLSRQWVRQHGVAIALCQKLEAARDAEARGNTRARDGALGAYRNQVKALAGHWLTREQATILDALADALGS